MVFSVEFDESLYFQGFDGIFEDDFDSLLDEILWIECDFWLSSIEALFFKALR